MTTAPEAGITVSTLKHAWGKVIDEIPPVMRVKESLENSHDQAARDMYNEGQKALSKRTLILDPELPEQCIDHVRGCNQGKALGAMDKQHDIFLLGIWEYIYQWALRIEQRVPKDISEIYTKLQNHGLETYAITKILGTAQLILLHISRTNRESDTQYNFNTLGLARHAAPQYAKNGDLKGATITFITNGGSRSALEFLSNVQAASNALQRLVENKTQCEERKCPIEPLTTGTTTQPPWEGRDFLQYLVLGRLLIKTEQTPAQTRASLNQSASFLSARTVQTASELKPFFKNIAKGPTARETPQTTKACEMLVGDAEKENNPRNFRNAPKSSPRSNAEKLGRGF